MAAKFTTQLNAVLYKSFLLKKKTLVGTLFELFFPLFLAAVFILIVKTQGNSDAKSAYPLIFNILLYLVLSFSLSKLAGLLVMERETKIREMMKILGLRDIVFYLAWWIFYASLMFVVCLSICFPVVYGDILPHSPNPIVLFLFYFSFCAAAISFAMLMSSPFNSVRVAQTVGFLIFYAISQIQWAVESTWSYSAQFAMYFFFPQVSFSIGIRQINNDYDVLTFQTWNISYDNYISMLGLIWISVLSAIFYFVLFCYIDQIIPHAVGVRKSIWFPLTLLCSKRNTKTFGSNTKCSMSNLTKQFGSKIALSNFSIELDVGDMNILLGENGAGKTTLINILTGMIEKTSGSMNIFGESEVFQIRSSLGFCPQHDVQWPSLTVGEHFQVFGRIRGVPREEITRQCEKMCALLNLDSQKPAGSLSGGMKRKLSVGVAFLGEPKFVILDEPTSGLDPFSRRQLWDVLASLKDDRVILLSTHYMDEAEVLGDRIVIVSKGVMKANGTALELQREYHCGYLLKILPTPLVSASAVFALTQSIVPQAILVPDEKMIVLKLPMETTPLFEKLLTSLSAQGITNLELVSTRLDEVFMKIVNENMSESLEEVTNVGHLKSSVPVQYCSPGLALFLNHIIATYHKRYRMFVCKLKTAFLVHLYPIIVIGLGLYFKSSMGTTPSNSTSFDPQAVYSSVGDIMLVVCLMVAYSSIPSSLNSVLFREVKCQSKFLQYVAGLSPTGFWLGNFLADLTDFYIFPFTITLILFATLQSSINIGPLAALLLLFGPAIIAQTYFISVVVPNRNGAMVIGILVNSIIGSILPFVTYAFKFTDSSFNDWEGIFRIFPSYNLGSGLLEIPLTNLIVQFSPIDPSIVAEYPYVSWNTDIYSWNAIGACLAAMGILIPCFLTLAIVVDEAKYAHKFTRQFSVAPPAQVVEDESVQTERSKILAKDSIYNLQVKNVSKKYSKGGPFAVSNVPLAIPKMGEVFSLLGCNGAGKTSLIKLCTGEILPSNGEILVGSFSTKKNLKHFRHLLGYCPQFDALTLEITVRDHLELYSRIKGVSRSSLKLVVDKWINGLGLKSFENTPANDLSGGFRRRLSLGIALLGQPGIVLLDEPSCGMDPRARREIWKVIQQVSEEDCSIVVTTHSMEEAEAISTRLGIMSQGRMVCMGTVPSLREKFSNGLEIFVQTKDSENLDELKKQFENRFSNIEKYISHGRTIRFLIVPGPEGITPKFVAPIFGLLEEMKTDLIKDYAVTQNSLEQVFQSIAALGIESNRLE